MSRIVGVKGIGPFPRRPNGRKPQDIDSPLNSDELAIVQDIVLTQDSLIAIGKRASRIFAPMAYTDRAGERKLLALMIRMVRNKQNL